MAKASRGVWAIDIGTCSLKAVKIRKSEEGLEVVGFDYLEHSKILSVPDIGQEDRIQAVQETLQKFLSQHDLAKDEVAVSIAGQNSFARFIKLPPVEPKKIPEIVQFEAVQQIPFDINEVEWDWQVMQEADSPDTKVGIFAIKNELISEVMDHFTQENLRVTCVQIAPMALYNYLLYDQDDVSPMGGKATIILDMGSENTTLVICTKDSVWQRSIRIGGNTFTEAIADAFKLNFAKAEKLKRTAPMSKYMRQIFTAMKPVYTDLGSEIQRSLGFYASSESGRDKGFSRIIALGGGMKLQGLTKYLQQSLGVPVIKPDSFNKLNMSPELSSAKFHENVSDFGIVYGLGVQILDDSKISINLLPRRIARAISWTRKSRLFTIAAGVLILVSVLGLLKQFRDVQQYKSNESIRRSTQAVISQAQQSQSTLNDLESRKGPLEQKIQKELDRFQYRGIIPELTEVLLSCRPNKENTPSQAALYDAFNNGWVRDIRAIPRPERQLMFITRIQTNYASDLLTADFPKTGVRSGGVGGGMRSWSGAGEGGMGESFGGRRSSAFSGSPMGGRTSGTMTAGETPAQGGPGFTIIIEGYSPYKDITQLLDPPGVGADTSHWGMVTRFKNLKQIFPDVPFELFEPGNINHFKVDWGYVDLNDPEMPSGIGVFKEIERASSESGTTVGAGMTGGIERARVNRISTETVLVDPMTNEEISKVYDIITPKEVASNPDLTEKDIGRVEFDEFGKEKYIYRDSWFRIQAKFKWPEAPAAASQNAAGTNNMGMY